MKKISTANTRHSVLSAEARFEWLSRPLASFWCRLAWLYSTILFFLISQVVGGPTDSDVAESVYSTWAIAHGDLACTFQMAGGTHLIEVAKPTALTAPLYPLVSGLVGALLRIGHSVAFPSPQEFGPTCLWANQAMFNWSVKAHTIIATINLAYVVWPFLLIGTVAVVRAAGRGHTRWEPVSLLLVACMPPLYMCFADYFHPQDLMAFGLATVGLALFMRRRWFWAGVFIGLAVSTQQFALLIGAVFLVVAPSGARRSYVGGALIAAALIDVPLIIMTSGRALQTVLFGSNRVGENLRSTGGSVLWETHAQGIILFLFARLLPAVLTVLLAWWASNRLGTRLLEPVPLLSLVATALCLRLVFEENLFGYYFMAVSLTLLLLDIASGHFRGQVMAWIALVTLAFNPFHLGFFSNEAPQSVFFNEALPIFFLAVVLISIAIDATHRRFRLYKFVWVVIVLVTCENRIWGMYRTVYIAPRWMWQVILVPTALVLCYRPLFQLIRQPEEVGAIASTPDPSVEPVA